MIYFANDQSLKEQLEKLSSEDYQNWIQFKLTTSSEYETFVGMEDNMYTLKVSKVCSKWEYALFDFIGYEESHGKNMILHVSPEDFKQAQRRYGNHHFQEKQIRADEPKVLIHSTPWRSWENIQAEGTLKSWHILKRENPDFEAEPIGKQLGDPENYRDYIMFSNGHVASEIVVLSKQSGYVDMNHDKLYQTGARLYLDMTAIAKDGLLVRDGAHLKVKNELPLEKYLIWVGTWETAGLENQVSTPLAFTTKANNKFNELYGNVFGDVTTLSTRNLKA
ncbi:MAG: hypothetical protein FWE07_07590 [Turicibacter sp.]|nr:hypothetical protein [Turicibacter sp.]